MTASSAWMPPVSLSIKSLHDTVLLCRQWVDGLCDLCRGPSTSTQKLPLL